MGKIILNVLSRPECDVSRSLEKFFTKQEVGCYAAPVERRSLNL